MLTIEREVSQIVSELPKKIKLEFCPEFKLDNRDSGDPIIKFLQNLLKCVSDAVRQKKM